LQGLYDNYVEYVGNEFGQGASATESQKGITDIPAALSGPLSFCLVRMFFQR